MNKIAIFTDIHWGHNKDNVSKLQNTQEFIKYFIKTNQSKIDTVIFLGDFFDNQTSINVQTLNTAYVNLKMLCKFFKVYMILGNHDLFLRNSNKIHSVKPFNEIQNLEIIDKVTEIDFNGKKGLMCPWGTDIKEIKTDYSYLFGHFNVNGAELCGSIYNKGRYSMQDLTDIATLVFSGHFHIQKVYDTKSGQLITVGSPLELNWADYNNTKGFYLLNTQTKEYEFIENQFSPKHIKLLWSEVKDNLENINITGNYIKLLVDCEYQYQDVLAKLEEIKTFKPISCNIEYIFSVNKNLLGEIKVSKKEINLDKIDYIHKFIDKMKTDVDQDIDWLSVKTKMSEYYSLV